MNSTRLILSLLIIAAALGAQVIANSPSGLLPVATFASPPSSPATNQAYHFTDASALGACTGGGTSDSICSWSGAAWVATSAAAGAASNLSGGANGFLPYQSAASTTAMLSGNTAATDKVLVSHGTGAAAQAPTLSNAPALSAANMTSFPTTVVSSGGTGLQTLTAHNFMLGEGTSNVAFLSCGLGTTVAGSATDPTCTATPTLGVASTTTGTLAFANSGNTGVMTLTPASGTVAATVTIPDVTGTLVGSGDTGTVTNTMLAGSVALTKMANQTGGTVVANATGSAAAPTATNAPVLGVAGTSTGTIGLTGSTSGTATITAQNTAGSPTLTLPNATGTFAVSASAPLALSATTGNLSVSGATGQVPNGSTGAFTATPTLGVASTTTGTLALANSGNTGVMTLTPASGTVAATVTIPDVTGTLVGSGDTGTVTNTMLAGSVALTKMANQTGGTVVANATGSAAAPTATNAPVLGVAGTSTGTIGLTGSTSGTATITAQNTAGSPTLTLPNATGTFAVSASAPLALSATTGNLSVSGAAGQVPNGSTGAFTATPTLGVAGSTVGSVAFANATSGTVTVQPVTGALGSVTVSLPAATGTVAVSATSPITESATGAIGCATCVTSSGGGAATATAPINVSAAGLISLSAPGATASAAGLPGGVSDITANVGATTGTTELTVTSYQIPANTIAAGTAYRLRAHGLCTTSVGEAVHLWIRYGTNDNSGTAILGGSALTTTGSGSSVVWDLEVMVTWRSTSGVIVEGKLFNTNTTTGIVASVLTFMGPTITSALTTSSANYLQFSMQGNTNSTLTTQQAWWELVHL